MSFSFFSSLTIFLIPNPGQHTLDSSISLKDNITLQTDDTTVLRVGLSTDKHTITPRGKFDDKNPQEMFVIITAKFFLITGIARIAGRISRHQLKICSPYKSLHTLLKAHCRKTYTFRSNFVFFQTFRTFCSVHSPARWEESTSYTYVPIKSHRI